MGPCQKTYARSPHDGCSVPSQSPCPGLAMVTLTRKSTTSVRRLQMILTQSLICLGAASKVPAELVHHQKWYRRSRGSQLSLGTPSLVVSKISVLQLGTSSDLIVRASIPLLVRCSLPQSGLLCHHPFRQASATRLRRFLCTIALSRHTEGYQELVRR
jgi:hypothetical protein